MNLFLVMVQLVMFFINIRENVESYDFENSVFLVLFSMISVFVVDFHRFGLVWIVTGILQAQGRPGRSEQWFLGPNGG